MLHARVWWRVALAIAAAREAAHRPAEDHRQVLNGMLWILRMGAPWADLPVHYQVVGRDVPRPDEA